jgi:hypothetical protein
MSDGDSDGLPDTIPVEAGHDSDLKLDPDTHREFWAA